MDLKMNAAVGAIAFIKEGNAVGLGAGATIANIVKLLAEQKDSYGDINLFTSSFSTHQLLTKHGFPVRSVSDITALDIYIDGCDQLDKDLNALKSGGGIHTREKLLASMAKQFLLVGDAAKYSERFDGRFPVVVELLREAVSFVPVKVAALFPGTRSELRTSDRKDGLTITDNGNYLLDVWFTEWPELKLLNILMKGIAGVVETSLFYNLAHKAILAGEDGVKVLER
jgi:ribose 5-phosphate isomerase A